MIESCSSLYLHVPFCERKCEYCDFVSLPGRDAEREYVDVLCAEIRGIGSRIGPQHLDTIFIGGGTPSFIDPGGIAGILDAVSDAFDIASDAEVTLEANPSSTNVVRAQHWRSAGCNRVSLGVQSLHADVLGFLGRVHDGRRALEAISEVRSAGFVRVSTDLIYAVPGLDDERWRQTLEAVVAAGGDHVSAYELTVEPGTPLHAAVRHGRVATVATDSALAQHRIAVEVLGSAGLAQYEVSNFARPGQEGRHNLRYWNRGTYLAAGLGAHGHVGPETARALGLGDGGPAESVRYWHGRSLPRYLASAGAFPGVVSGSEDVNDEAAAEEHILLGLRLTEGVELPAERQGVVAELVDVGLLHRAGTRVAVTDRGQEVLDEVIRRLVA